MFYIKSYRNLLPVAKTLKKVCQVVKMSSSSVKGHPLAAICHMRATTDKKANYEQVIQIVEKAKSLKAEIVFIPECCDFVGENRVQTLELAEPFDSGDLIKKYRQLAKTNQVWLSLGGLHEATYNKDGSKANKIYNSHVLIDNLGEIKAIYRKLHLFDVSVPDFKFRESDVVHKGYEIVPPVQTPIGKVGLQICYDMRFPESSLILNKQGAQILTYPAAFAYATGKVHWKILLCSRAIENQCFVIAPAQIGWHNKKRQSYGHAMIIDPWGKVIATCDNDKELDVVVAEIDLNNVKRVRANMPCPEHRRSDIYTLAPLSVPESKFNEDRKFGPHTIDKRTIFYETDLSYAFTNIRCVVKGHVLVASKRIAARLPDLTHDEITDIFHTVAKLQKILQPFHGTTSTTMTIQDGPESGQTVPHVHFHILPRRKEDFKFNDMIYYELNKHDHNPKTSERCLEERIEEAQKYRRAIKELFYQP